MSDFDNNSTPNTDAESEDYAFVTETIKKRPINTRKIIKKILITIVLAVVFGLVATITLVLVYPRLYEKLYPMDDTRPVSLPVAQEEISEEALEEFVPTDSEVEEEHQEDDSDKDEGTIEVEQDSQVKENPEQEAEDEEVLPENGTDEEKNVVINQVVETIEKNLELEDYRILLRKVSAIANTTAKSLVTVSGRKSNTDWFNNSYEDNDTSTGIILADNGKELLIISPSSILSTASYVDVTFNNGVTCSAMKKASDANTGLSVVAVSLSSIPEDTLEEIEMAEFGSVAASASGMPVVAVGAPYGVAGSMAMGQITSNSVVIDKCDSDVKLISTDIYGSTQATGVLVNYSGRIIGIICHDDAMTDMPNLIRAYSAENIMSSIEKMSNGSKITCFGIKGTDVTQEASESYGVPSGLYVKEVILDSPAMNVGIRNGDVIIKMGVNTIESYDDFKEVMLASRPGDTYVVELMRPSGSNYVEISYEVTMEELK